MIGVVAVSEPLYDSEKYSEIARNGPICVMLEIRSNKIGGLSYSPRDYVFIPKGQCVALLKITKKK